jgi:hypothetical protein
MKILYIQPHRIVLEAEHDRDRKLLVKLETLLPAMLDEAVEKENHDES